MNRSTRVSLRAAAGVVAVLSMLAGTTAVNAADAGTKTVLPAHGVSIDVGSKRVIGYFVAKNDACNLTFLMSDQQVDDVVPNFAARMQQVIAANATAHIDTAEGESLELVCQPAAASMTVRRLTQVATYKVAK
jgi:hypothetical protein